MTVPDSAPCRPPGAVALTVITTCELTVVAATGDLDNAVAGRLRECLAGEVLLRPGGLIVDLSRAGFCSAGIIRVLLETQRHARADGIPCAVVSARRAVVRPVTALGLVHLVQLHPDIAAAEDWLTVVASEAVNSEPGTSSPGAAFPERPA
jgi:anti-sigma B factor antagonist